MPDLLHKNCQLTLSGVIATLRLLFARQAKGKRKLVLRRILHQLSDFSAHWEKPHAAVSRFMRLDNGSFWAHRCGHVVGSLFLAKLSSPSYRLWLSKQYWGVPGGRNGPAAIKATQT